MRAVRISAPGSARLVDLSPPEPGPGEVLVRVARAGLCPTDRKLAARGADPPRVPGHELGGLLEDGTPVGVHPDLGCGACGQCAAGFENRCADRVSIGLDRDGGLAEQVAVPAGHVLPLEGVPMDVAPLLEPLACCLHATGLLELEEGAPALVVGAGAMGILNLWALQAAGARVGIVQRSEPRRSLARRLGADEVVDTGDDPVAVLGEPPAAVVVTAPTAAALRWALERVRVGGVVHAFAGMPEGGEVDANLIHYRHLRLVGSTGSRVSDYRRARDLAAQGRVKLGLLPTTVVTLEEAPRSLRFEPEDRTVLRVLVDVRREEAVREA